MESDGGAVSLDGIMRFRMKDLTKKWSEELRKCCDEYIINTDGAELISMLKYIVSVREPLVGRVSVAPGESGYEIFSGAMRIGVVLIDEGEMSAEEALITRLIHLCPREQSERSAAQGDGVSDIWRENGVFLSSRFARLLFFTGKTAWTAFMAAKTVVFYIFS